MNDLIISGLVLAAEVAAGLVFLALIGGMIVFLRHRRRTASARTFVSMVKKHKQSQPDKFLKTLGSNSGDMTPELEEQIAALGKQETRVYSVGLKLFRTRRPELLARLFRETGSLMNLTNELATQVSAARSLAQFQDKLEQAQQEKMQLVTELNESRAELATVRAQLDGVQKEYTAMYNAQRRRSG